MKAYITLISIMFAFTDTSEGVKTQQQLRGSDQSIRGVAFNGGGFRAHAVHTGLVSGLMSQLEGSGGEQLQSIFQSTQLIGSNSGGSWFASQLLYSNNFATMLNQIAMANSSETAYEIYYDEWIRKLETRRRRVTSIGNDLMAVLEKLWTYLSKSSSLLESWSFIIFKYIFEDDLSWQDFVQSIIEIPGDIDATLPLSEVSPATWAQDKSWAIAGVALTSPTHDILGAYNIQCTTNSQVVDRSFGYTIPSAESINYPITFSTTLSAQQSNAPFPFVSGLEETSIQYSLLSAPNPNVYGKEWGSTLQEFDLNGTILAQSFQTYSNGVPFVSAVATSSAFLGEILAIPALLQKWDNALATLLGDEWFKLWGDLLNMPMYMASGVEPALAFQQGQSVRSPSSGMDCDAWMQLVGQNQFLTLADGGYADNTGVSRLVGNGMADEIILFLNENGESDGDFYGLFTDATPKPSYFSSFPIFEQTASAVQAQVEEMTAISASSTSSLLKQIRFGTIFATTIDQPAFGVTAGRTVTIRVLICDADVGMGSVNWDVYPQVVGEIQGLMTDPTNKAIISAQILPWFQ